MAKKRDFASSTRDSIKRNNSNSKENESTILMAREAEMPPKEITKSQIPRSVGRPKKEPTVQRTVYIPEKLYELVDSGPLCLHKGNLSEYLSKLIEADLKTNKELYDRFRI